MEHPTDHDLWARAVRGDTTAFGEIYTRHARAVQAFAVWRSSDPAQSEDVTSIVFLEAWRQRAKLSLDPSITTARPLLLGIATNVIRTHSRSRRRHSAALSRLDAGAHGVSHEDRSIERLEAEREVRELRTALSALPTRELDVLAIIAWGDLTYEEAAVALDMPVGTVRSRLSRARGRLTSGGGRATATSVLDLLPGDGQPSTCTPLPSTGGASS